MSGIALAWVLLCGAIVIEVAATLCLRMAVAGSRWWYVPVVVGYASAFSLLSLTLAQGMGLGMAYGIWTAAGVALTAIAGRVLFQERLTWVMTLGIALIIGGVLLIELGASH